MYEITLKGAFSATHQLKSADGFSEPLHGHDWKVSVCLAAEDLNEAGMVADFAILQAGLDAVTAQLHHRHLNEHQWLEGMSPTAERVARAIFDRLLGSGPWGGQLRSVEVTETPGCAARYVR